MAFTKIPFVQRQLAKRIESATHIRPIFMPKDEFEYLLHRKILDAAGPEILVMIKPLTAIRALGQKGALELLFKIGLVLSELDIPNIKESKK